MFPPQRSSPWRAIRGWLAGVLFLGAGIPGAIPTAVAASTASVRLELRIPEAETYVLGDAIPLLWRFGNEGSEPLGFLWEGCCRLNGKLEVRAATGSLATVPTGQALAHMFAKADRLDPGQPKDYETKVSDWVSLPGTGTYELRGTYRGVLPTQSPQVARGLALWRDAAESAPVRLRVLGVADYLAEREVRERARGLRSTLLGPDRLLPLAPATFRVALENLRDEPQTLTWPDDESLWVLNSRDERVAAAAVIPGNSTPVAVPARGRIEREFVLTADRFEGEPLADYRLFVDFAAAGPGQPRVPSTVLALGWRLDPAQVAELVRAASRGAGTGARNAPLKLLRVYLAELAEALAALDRSGLSPEGVVLADRLARAARLKPVSPRPGAVDLAVIVPTTGRPEWVRSEVAMAAGPGREFPAQVAEILALRRHLGWEVGVVFEPTRETPVERLAVLSASLEGVRSELAVPPAVVLPTSGTNAPARLVLAAEGTPGPGRAGSGPGVRVTAAGREWSEDGVVFRALPATGTGPAFPAGAGGVRVWVEKGLTWGRLREAVEPWIQPGARLELGIVGPN